MTGEPMTRWRFFVEGTPKGQPRPRAFVRNGRVAVYDAGTAEGWKAQVALAARAAGLAGHQCAGPVTLTCKFMLPRPKRLFGKRSDPGELPFVGKPDIDNLVKAVADSLTQIGAWHDDSQVFDLVASKHYAAIGNPTGAWITVQEAP